MGDVIERIRADLLQNADPRTKASGERFFKEEVQLYGVRTALVTALARKYLAEVRSRGKANVFGLCELLWQSGLMEESFIACHWSHAFSAHYTPDDFSIFERWASQYVSNWAQCDTLCNHTVGAFVDAYPEHLDNLKRWALSDNRWMRRAAAVTLIISARHGRFLQDVFAIADILLLDSDDLVQKGYGWLLKAAAEAHRDEVFDFVMQRKRIMPRTALRYAIEKMPPEMKTRAMAK